MGRTRRRKKRTHIPEEEGPQKNVPKSFVFRRGKHGYVLKDLEVDLRKLMHPHTASKLKESKRNVLKDFVHIAGPLGVTHFLVLTATENASYLRIAKTPRGPTLTLRIHEYALIRDVVASQQRPRVPSNMWLSAPLLVLNNFGSDEHLKLATVLFQNLFPPINVQEVNLSSCQRVVTLSYNKDTGRISLRHYGITVAPSGVSKSLKELVQGKTLPDLGKYEDVSEFLLKSGYGSESEGEEAAESRVTLEQDLGKGNLASRQSRVRLQEVGPRLELEVVKVEEGLCDGEVLYHKYVEKSQQEVQHLQKRKREEAEVKAKRRKQQEENVKRKKEVADRKVQEGGQGKEKRQKMWWEEEMEAAKLNSDDDDVKYYKQEVGEEPDNDFVRNARHKGSGKRGGKGGPGRGKGAKGGMWKKGKRP